MSEISQYLNTYCSNQSIYHNIIDCILNLYTPFTEKSDPQPKINKIVTDWQKIVELKNKDASTGLPLVGLRFIQLMEFGSEHGWLNSDLMKKINAIALLSDLYEIILDKEGQFNWAPRNDYTIIPTLLNHLYHEIEYSLPYFPERFKYIRKKYCQKHLEALNKIDAAQRLLSDEDLKTYIQKQANKNSLNITAKQIDPEAVTTLQKHIRGFNALQNTILPSQISKIFREHIIRQLPGGFSCGSQDSISTVESVREINGNLEIVETIHVVDPIDILIKDICEQIKKIITDPQTYRKKTVKMLTPDCALDDNSPFSSFYVTLELTKDEQAIQVVLVNRDLDILAEGRYKQTKRAHRFLIPLAIENDQRATEYTNQVIFSAVEKKASSDSHVPSPNLVDELFCSYEIQKRIEAHLPELKLIRRSFIKGVEKKLKAFDDLYPNEALEPWLNCDLKKAFIDKSIPLDFNLEPKTQAVTLIDFLPWFIKIAEDLTKLHQIGIVHRDVTPFNIMLEKVGEQVEACLIDLTFAIGIGKDTEISPHFYWDSLANKGIFTPYTDLFSLALSITLLMTSFIKFERGNEEIFNNLKENPSEGNKRILLKVILEKFKRRLKNIQQESSHKNLFFPLEHTFSSRTYSTFQKLSSISPKLEEILQHNTALDPAFKKKLADTATEALAATSAWEMFEKTLAMNRSVIEIVAHSTVDDQQILLTGTLNEKLLLMKKIAKDIPFDLVGLLKAMKGKLDVLQARLEKPMQASAC